MEHSGHHSENRYFLCFLEDQRFPQQSAYLHLSKILNLNTDGRRGSGSSGGGLIRQESESFAAEIPLRDGWHEDGDGNWIEHETWHLQWLNPDGGNPFPASVSKIVDWLIRFQPKDGKSFDYADYPDVCPTGGLRLLQPAIAENSHP
jgi:hypothetical protein